MLEKGEAGGWSWPLSYPSACGGVNQPSHYVPVGGNQSDSDELDLEEHDYDSLDGELNHNNASENVNDQQDTGSGGANYSQDD